jgi:hypothetical protein
MHVSALWADPVFSASRRFCVCRHHALLAQICRMDSICCMAFMWLWRVRELVELSALPTKQLESTFPKKSMVLCILLTKKKTASLQKQNTNRIGPLNVDLDLLTGSVRTFPGGWLTRSIWDLPLGSLVELSTTFAHAILEYHLFRHRSWV